MTSPTLWSGERDLISGMLGLDRYRGRCLVGPTSRLEAIGPDKEYSFSAEERKELALRLQTATGLDDLPVPEPDEQLEEYQKRLEAAIITRIAQRLADYVRTEFGEDPFESEV